MSCAVCGRPLAQDDDDQTPGTCGCLGLDPETAAQLARAVELLMGRLA